MALKYSFQYLNSKHSFVFLCFFIVFILLIFVNWAPSFGNQLPIVVAVATTQKKQYYSKYATIEQNSRRIRSSSFHLGERSLVPFDPHGNDTMVYMHIQKTGGSQFLEHLVTVQKTVDKMQEKTFVNAPSHQLQLCENRTDGWTRQGGYMGRGKKLFIHFVSCPRNPLNKEGETWLVSEKTTSWMCGVHAFYTDFKRCLSDLSANLYFFRKFPVVSENRRFHYVTILRHPILRFLSEYLHRLRGACWSRDHYCNSKKTHWPLASNLSKSCFELIHCSQKEHSSLTLEEFSDCKESWSNNRQTLMLADIDEATCWNKSRYTQKERNRLLLDSAKDNLQKLSYFGLTEFQEESGVLFERTFGLKFLNPPMKTDFCETHASKEIHSVVKNIELYKKVVQSNCLDLKLYEFALGLFEQRLNAIWKPLNKTVLDHIRSTLPDVSVCT